MLKTQAELIIDIKNQLSKNTEIEAGFTYNKKTIPEAD
jgi:hypothetical protein